MGGSGWLSPPATTTGTPAPSLRHLRRRPSPLGPPTSPTSIPPLVITEIALTSTRRAETSSRRGLARRARRTPSAAQVWRVPTWPASPQASSARALPPPPSPTSAPTPCSQSAVTVGIVTDNYPGETSWTLENTCNGDQVGSGGSYTSSNTEYKEEFCVPP